MTDKQLKAYWKWVRKGVSEGWCTQSFCMTHDGDPYMSEEDMKDWDDGGDPCCVVVKLIPEH